MGNCNHNITEQAVTRFAATDFRYTELTFTKNFALRQDDEDIRVRRTHKISTQD